MSDNLQNETNETPANGDHLPQSDEAATEASQDVATTPQVDELEAVRSELESVQDRLLRSQAELENYRKRTRRELEEKQRYAALPLMSDLLAVVDNLRRAIDSAGESDRESGLLAGVEMVASQMDRVLVQYGCEPIQALGQPFDPNMHEAVQMEPSDEHPSNTVCKQVRVGYRLHDRIVRPAQVFVSTGPPTDPPA